MNDSLPCIVIYGLDTTLLQTRRWVLKSAKYQAVTVTDLSQLALIPERPPMRLLILCHSLDQEDCTNALKLAASRWPGIKSLVLARNVLQQSFAGPVALSTEGPATLLSVVSTLVGQPAEML